jgi:signal transduction histidine kinase/CheY-like chemotaxis protein
MHDRQFRRLVEKLPAGAYTCDANGLITYYNQRAVELWGRAPLLNDPADRFCGSFKLFSIDGTAINHCECWMALALRDEQEYNGQEIIIERPDGSRCIALAHANPVYDESGKLIGAVNVLVDISEQKRAENLLREADRHKNEFLATLAHELRNPLAPINNALHVIRRAGDNTHMLEQARAMMDRQVGHMVRLIDDLLDVSRITLGKIELRKERIELAAAVQDAIETSRPLIESLGHELCFKIPSHSIIVHGDRTRLAQVFANLLNNSAKYTKPGGHIELAIERQGSDVVVRVKDDGVGIPKDKLSSIFEMFTQVDGALERSGGGLGIGLSLVRGLVQMHGGHVEACSNGKGKGSEFTVRLPIVLSPPVRDEEAANDAAVESGSKHRILVVDDNRDSAISLSLMLKLMGHVVETSHDGLQAVEAAGSFLPDVALVDIGLPGLNGYEVCRQIRQQSWGTEMVLIALTGWGQDEDKRRSKEAGFNFHLVKPVDVAILENLLAGLLLTPS